MAFRFQGFRVYIEARKFIGDIFKITSKFPKDEQFGLTSQLRRAAVSIALNVAEGSDRGSDKEFNRFIRMSMASVNEVVAALDISLDNKYLDKNNYETLISQAERIVKQLSSFSKKLKTVSCKRSEPLAVSQKEKR